MPYDDCMALRRVTLNLTEQSQDAIETGENCEGLNQTDYINRAIRLYDFVLREEAAGRTLWVRDADMPTVYSRVMLL